VATATVVPSSHTSIFQAPTPDEPNRKRRRIDDGGALVGLDKRVTESATSKAYSYGCPICNHQMDRQTYIKDHMTKEIQRFNSSFYGIAGYQSLKPPDVSSWVCGFCTDREPFSDLSQLVNHVSEDHCRRLGHEETNHRSFEPFLSTWCFSTVMHNHLNHGLLKQEYSNTVRIVIKTPHRPRLIWLIDQQTLKILQRLQTFDYNEDNAKDLAKEAVKASSRFTYTYPTKRIQRRPNQDNRGDGPPSGAAGGGESFRGNESPSNEEPSTNVGTSGGGDIVSQNTQVSIQHQAAPCEPASVAHGTPGRGFSDIYCPSELISSGRPNQSVSDSAINTPNAHIPDNTNESAASGRGSAGEDPLADIDIGLGHVGVWVDTDLPLAPRKALMSRCRRADLPQFTDSDSLDGLPPLERFMKNNHDRRMFVMRSRTDSSKTTTSANDVFESPEGAQIRYGWSDRAGIGTDDSESEVESRRSKFPTRVADARPTRCVSERQSRLRRLSNPATPLSPVSFT
jgi:hypothetical protein